MTSQIRQIIVKYLNQAASFQELDELTHWIKAPGHTEEFQSFVRTHYAIDHIMKDFDTEQEKTKLLINIREAERQNKVRRLWTNATAVAASILVIVSLGLYIGQKAKAPIYTPPVIVDNTIRPGTDKATLTLEDGSTVILEKGTNYQSANARSNGEEIVYGSNPAPKTKNDGPATNTLTVPRGGQFFLTLADGTKVWLNSESQLKYPVAFKNGEPRVIELVYGEGYFDVSPSSENEGSQFQVHNKYQTVQVLGTEFNIKAYTGETHIYTTLVEGKVALSYDRNTPASPAGRQNLLPDQQLQYNVQDKTISLSKVNVSDVISWKEGVFSFDYTPLEDIMKVLERWYDMQVVFENDTLRKERFIGSINKKYTIEEVLSALMETNIIQTYEIHQNTIVLK
ncbi:FecR family protein [Flagellimonas olearia]|uniref:DUF4974 domain-containing protein n=1 Tax=Flagellimonas olearia TaxID=552546 RepID=A0A444VHY1_9FLAO|nr:FecR family protein [Allomuricauda olearia]RYC50353.1 hypothetical protein DN53_05360 [Allomuricauda olearia]